MPFAKNHYAQGGFPYARLGGTKAVCRLRYFARSARAPLRRNSFASKTFSSCRTQIAADKGNSLVRHARTAHRAAAHYAWLTLKEGGKNSHRPCGAPLGDTKVVCRLGHEIAAEMAIS